MPGSLAVRRADASIQGPDVSLKFLPDNPLFGACALRYCPL